EERLVLDLRRFDRRARERDVDALPLERVRRCHRVVPQAQIVDRDLDVRMLLGVARPDAVERAPQPPRHPDADDAGAAAPDALRRLHELVGHRAEPSRFFEQERAAIGQLDALWPADEQLRADFALELLDLPAERGLRDMQAPGGVGETQLLGDDDKGADVPQVHRRYLTRSPRECKGLLLDFLM